MATPFASVTYYCADQNPHRDRSRGITNLTAGLLQRLHATGQVQMELITSRSSHPICDGIARRQLAFRTDHFLGRLAGDHLHPFLVAGARRPGKNRLWHYPKGFLPWGAQVRAPRVGTVCDVILQFYADRYPASRPALDFRYWLGLLKRSIPRFDLILTISEFSRQAILAFSERYNLRCPPIIVTYPGMDPATPEDGGNGKENTVLHMASKLPHKGTGWLLRQWRHLEESAGAADLPTLRLIGEIGDDERGLLAGLRTASLQAALPRREMLAALARARALLLPSEIEGFGLPALEAYSLGTPVAYVRCTCVEEILGRGRPGGFEMDTADSADSLRAALGETLSMDPAEVARTKTELEARFSWQDCVDKTLAGYRSLLS